MSDNYKRRVPYDDSVKLTKYEGFVSTTKDIDRFLPDPIQYFMEKLDILIDECVLKEYYLCYHNKIKDNLHIHFAIILNKQVRITTICNKISSLLNVSTLAITIDSLDSLRGIINYWLHDEDGKSDKYEITDIYYSVDDEVFDTLMTSKDGTITFEYLFELCCQSEHVCDVMRRLGIGVYHKYRYEIRDIFEYSRFMQSKYQIATKNTKDTPF